MAEVYSGISDRLSTLSEFDLCNEVQPGPTDYALRRNFTEEVRRAKTEGAKVRMTPIWEGVISKQVFYNYYMKEPLKVAFFTRPVVCHTAYYDAIFKEGLRKLFTYVKNHDLDPKTMATFARIVEKAADRAIGPVVQRIAMHQKQEITHSGSIGEREVDTNDPVQIRAKIEELQKRMTAAKAVEISGKVVIDDE